MAASLEERVGNGMVWLTDHDPTGRFHLWFTARILPGTPMPTQTEQSVEDYRTYYKARQQWERLFAAMEAQAGRNSTDSPVP